MGWSDEEAGRATACEVNPGDAGRSDREFNVTLAQNSDGLMPMVDPENIRILTAWGSHTVAGLRVALLGAVGIHDEICLDGRVSRERLIEMSPSIREPIASGMMRNITRWQLVEACPRLMMHLQEAGNASHGIERKQTEIQASLQIHTHVPWPAIGGPRANSRANS